MYMLDDPPRRCKLCCLAVGCDATKETYYCTPTTVWLRRSGVASTLESTWARSVFRVKIWTVPRYTETCTKT